MILEDYTSTCPSFYCIGVLSADYKIAGIKYKAHY